jgi:hypothetical protein
MGKGGYVVKFGSARCRNTPRRVQTSHRGLSTNVSLVLDVFFQMVWNMPKPGLHSVLLLFSRLSFWLGQYQMMSASLAEYPS